MLFEKDEVLYIQNGSADAVEVSDDDIALLQKQAKLDAIELAMEEFITELPNDEASAIADALTEEGYDLAVTEAEKALDHLIDDNLKSIVRGCLYEAAFKDKE